MDSKNSEILTILKSATIKLCKTAIKEGSDTPQFTNVGTPKFFTYEHASIESLTDLYDVVSRYSTTRLHCLVRGQLRDDIDPTRRIRRKLRKEAADPNEEPFEDLDKQQQLAQSEFWATKALAQGNYYGAENRAWASFYSRDSLSEEDIEERTQEIIAFLRQQLTS
jgi:hypothetical protein